ncbi:MAG TPA: hypothetical protein DIC54_14800 [Pseudomonas sp.]|nr:hypothetical protein [Pseudomonas sp.]
MAERPILFNGAMVRAILAGQKTQTRRAVKGVRADNCMSLHKPMKTMAGIVTHVLDAAERGLCPFGNPGDRLWVRETWTNAWDEGKGQWSDPELYHYRADGVEIAHVDDMQRSPWIPSIHMPRRACRLVLEVTNVRVERLQAISADDAVAEGIRPDGADGFHVEDGANYSDCAIESFASLWTSTGGDWDSNPWVWVIEFKRVEPAHG